MIHLVLMKKLLVFFILCLSIQTYSQIGIGTTSPKSTLDINGKPAIISEPDGLLPPRLLRAELINKTGYGTSQVGAIIYVTDLSGTNNTQTINVTEVGYYYFNGTVWIKMVNNNIPGDIKYGMQLIDHGGWVKLDGKLITTLTTSQQTQANVLGFSSNLPNANNAYLSQNGEALGSVSGTNTRLIARNQLPLFNLGGITNSAGSHSYVDVGGSYSSGYNNYPSIVENWAVIRGTGTIGDHSHTITTDNINNTGAQQVLDITPTSLSVNLFIYLGN